MASARRASQIPNTTNRLMEEGAKDVEMEEVETENVEKMDVGEGDEVSAVEQTKILSASWAELMEDEGREFGEQESSAPCPVRLGVKTSPPQGSVGLSSCSLVSNPVENFPQSEGLKRGSGSGSEGEVEVSVKNSKRKEAGAEAEAKSSSSTSGLSNQHYSVAGAEMDDEIPDFETEEGEMIELPPDLTRQQEDELLGLGVMEDVKVRVEERDADVAEPEQREEFRGGNSQSLPIVDDGAPRVIKESRVIPGLGVVEYKCHEHPFSKYQGTVDEELPACQIERLERKESLNRIQRFRDMSLVFANMKAGNGVEPIKLDQTAESLFAFDFPNDYSVMYTAVKIRTSGAFLTPVKLEVVAGDRVDLHSVILTKNSIDTLSGKSFDLSSLYSGDLIIVETLTPRQKYIDNPLPTSWEHVGDPEEQTYWEVGQAQRVRPIVKRGRWALALEEEDKKQRGRSLSFLVQDVTDVALVPRKNVSVKRGVLQDYVSVDVAVPVLQPGRFCRTFKPTYSQEEEVLARVQQHNHVWWIQPTILSVSELKKEVRAKLNDAKSWFVEGEKPTAEQFEHLAEITRFGVVTSLAMSSCKFDPRAYKAEITEVEKSIRYCILTVEVISPPSQNVSPARWQKGTAVVIALHNNTEAPATIVSSVASELGLSVRVKLVRMEDISSNITTELPAKVIVRHRKQCQIDNLRRAVGQLRPPTCTQNAHAMLLLAHIHGDCAKQADPLVIEDYPYRIGSFTPTEEQRRVYHVLRAPGWKGVIVGCGPGVGKTTAVVTAIIRHVEVNTAGAGLAVGTGSTNASVSAMIRSLRNRDVLQSVRFVRLVTASNLLKIDRMHHSNNDFPILWVTVLRKFLLENDRVGLTGEPEMLGCACRHLCARQEFSAKELKSEWLRGQTKRQYRTDPPKRSIMELLFVIYRPHLILGTSDSVRAFFTSNGYLSTVRESVETLWVDEASQLGRAQLVPLCFTFPTAKVVLVGDAQQLPPFREQNYPSRLNYLKNGPLFANLVSEKLLPTLKLSLVYRCPPQVVELFSKLFYEGNLIAHKHPQACQPFQSLGLPSQHPMMIVDTCSGDSVEGTSRTNDTEMELAVKLVRRFREKNPKKSVGVLTFYAAQTAKVAQRLPPEISVATIDGSQGNEYDLVLLLTTLGPSFQNNKFICDRHRLCVALSRAKEALVIFCNKKSAYAAPIWSTILDSVPKNQIVQKGDTPLFTV